MEELRSTDALDREILEDARKKAARALKDAEKNAREAEETWAAKLRTDIEDLERRHRQRIEAKRRELFARLPLEQRRLRAERSQRVLNAQMDAVLGAIDRPAMLELLRRRLSLRAAAFDSEAATARYAGLDAAEVQAMLSAALPAAFTVGGCRIELDAGNARAARLPTERLAAERRPSLVVENEDVVVRVGTAEIGEELLSEKRAELAAALLGPEACDD
jgi:vacuolar-type H+-ATPase subunit E/Vma4